MVQARRPFLADPGNSELADDRASPSGAELPEPTRNRRSDPCRCNDRFQGAAATLPL
jgi:hypothetical protein